MLNSFFFLSASESGSAIYFIKKRTELLFDSLHLITRHPRSHPFSKIQYAFKSIQDKSRKTRIDTILFRFPTCSILSSPAKLMKAHVMACAFILPQSRLAPHDFIVCMYPYLRAFLLLIFEKGPRNTQKAPNSNISISTTQYISLCI